MANFNKMDDLDFVFVNKPPTDEEEKEFSEFLKKKKENLKRKRYEHLIVSNKKQLQQPN